MHGEVEGCPCIHVWSLKHEGLLEGDWKGLKPITVWDSTFYMDHRKWHRRTEQLMACLVPPSSAAPDLPQETKPVEFLIGWRQDGSDCFSTFTATSIPRKVGNNIGARWWFLCPRCKHRVTALYFKHGRLGCRRCQDLVYQSERLTRKERARNRPGGWLKP